MSKNKLEVARPLNSKKFHVFFDGKSLCGKWMFFGHKDPDPVDASFGSQGYDDCQGCAKKLKRHMAKG